VRYFYLIVFADYLLEEMCVASDVEEISENNSQQPGRAKPRKRFGEWLGERREILNICKKSNQSLD
jgi:hypothetical protein